jgi:hypothetical protein
MPWLLDWITVSMGARTRAPICLLNRLCLFGMFGAIGNTASGISTRRVLPRNVLADALGTDGAV